MTAHWWAFLIRGIIAILFGIVIVMNPGIAVLTFILFFAGFAVRGRRDGADRGLPDRPKRGWLILEGIAGIGLGSLPSSTRSRRSGTLAIFLAYVVAAWALVTGIIEVVMAWRMRAAIKNEWFLIIIGALSIVLGLYLFFEPGLALLAWIWYVAFYAFLSGVGFIALAFRLRSHGSQAAAA